MVAARGFSFEGSAAERYVRSGLETVLFRVTQFHPPLPGPIGKYVRAGLNLVAEERHATETFRGWLAKRADPL
jgi:hypothetical protein